MQISAIRLQLRTRSPWESIDLGFFLARQRFIPLWKLWMIVATPLTIKIAPRTITTPTDVNQG